MTATLNGKDVISVVLNEPRIGVWNATVEADADAAISGKVTLVIDGVTWVGTMVKGDLHAGRVSAQIVGGAGKLAKVLDVKHYRGGTLGSVVNDLMRETGETLSSTTDAKVRSFSVSRWTRPIGKASVTLKQVSDEMKLVWRVLRDGTVWLGNDTWTEAKAVHDEIDRTPGRDALLIAPDAPHVQPGQTFEGKRVARVVTTIQEGGGLRQELQFESANGGNRVAEDIAAIIDQQTGTKIDFSRMYPARVVGQNGDGSLELIPDATVIRGNGLSAVPLRIGIPGISVRVPPGGRVNLFFENGDPKTPAAALWPDGSACLSAELTMASSLTITAPSVSITGNVSVTGIITALDCKTTSGTSLLLHPHTSSAPGNPTSPPIPTG